MNPKDPIKPPLIPVTRFSVGTHGVGQPYPWSYTPTTFEKHLRPGWRVVGQAKNSSLAKRVQRYETPEERFNAVMFTDPEGFFVWWHLGDYPYRFIQT